jgi:hypothetical protein
MLTRSILLGSFLAVSAIPALADENQGSSSSSARNKDPNRMICRTEEQIGSRVQKRRTCMTAAQWKDVSAEANRNLEKNTAQLPKPGG